MADTGQQGCVERGTPSVQLLERLAHDLRGPLAPLQTATWLLRQDRAGSPPDHELLDIIDRQSSRLGEMVEEISDWVRACDGRLIARRELVAVPLLLDLGAALDASLPDWHSGEGLDNRTVDGDTQRLVQMLDALTGFIRARGGVAGRTAALAGTCLRLTVTGGQPWTAGEPDRLFSAPDPEPFDQGLGMRLLVANEIARAHGGSMGTGGSDGRAAALWVELPLAG